MKKLRCVMVAAVAVVVMSGPAGAHFGMVIPL